MNTKLIILDLYGKAITVTDLDRAVEQAEMFMCMEHENATVEQQAADRERKQYWSDIYEKLLQLQ